MIIDLPPQIQNIPPRPIYAVIEQHDPNLLAECVISPEPLSKKTLPDPEHFGGYSETVSGTTTASLATGTTQVL